MEFKLIKNIKATIYGLISLGLVLLFSAIKIKILTNRMSLSDYGLTVLLTNVLPFIVNFSYLGTDNYLFRFGAENISGSLEMSNVIRRLSLLTILPIFLIVIFLFNGFSLSIYYLLILFVITVFFVYVQLYRVYIFTQRRYLVYYILAFFINSGYVILIFFKKTISINNIIIFLAISNLIMFLVILFDKNNTLSNFIKIKEFGLKLKVSLKFGINCLPLLLGFNVIFYADKYFIFRFLKQSDLSVYTFASSLSILFYVLPSVIFEAFKNEIYTSKSKKYYEQFSSFIIIFFVNILFFIYRNVQNIIMIFSNENYKTSAIYILILTVSSFFMSLITLTAYYLQKEYNVKIIGISYLIGCLVNIVLNFIFIKKYGLLAAAVISVLSNLIIFIIQVVYLKRKGYMVFNLYYKKLFIVNTGILIIYFILAKFVFEKFFTFTGLSWLYIDISFYLILILILILLVLRRYKENKVENFKISKIIK